MSDQAIPEYDPPVRNCDACGQSYVKSHLGDYGICRLCEVREDGIRNMIADEMRIILDDYHQQTLKAIWQKIAKHTGQSEIWERLINNTQNNPQP